MSELLDRATEGAAEASPDDPGLAGVRPFRFECHRCGRCCTAAGGYVFLAPGEDAALARAVGLDLGAFRALHVREVQHPDTAERVEALRDDGLGRGRCSLLEGANECRAYAARPEHCRAFPYWPSVIEDDAGFERAAETCPGIEEQVPPERWRAAFGELEAVYARLERVIAASRAVCLARGVCCRFEEAGHELFATALEVEYALHRHPKPAQPGHPDPPEPEAPGRCPYHRSSPDRPGGACTAREGRPLGCRTYFCDPGPGAALEQDHEELLREIRAIEARHGLPSRYARFPEQIVQRGGGA